LKYLVSIFASLLRRFQLFFKVVAHLATLGFASGALFLLGFYVIPVFAEKIPHVATESTHASNLSDEDADGVPDYWEKQIGSEILLGDTDGDGVSDGLEVGLKKKEIFDHDHDGRPDILDEDDDGDGIPTILEGTSDVDQDGLANYLDLDSDGDGISDRDEAGLTLGDADRDRIDDKFDVDFTKGRDDNGDGIDDKVVLSDANKNGVADFLDKATRVARTTLMNPVPKTVVTPKATQLASAKTPVVNSLETKRPAVSTFTTKLPKPTAITAKSDIEAQTKNQETNNAKAPPVVASKPKQPKGIEITDDSDGDGLSNAVELALGMNPMNADSDGDGVPDFIEIGRDNKSPQDSDQDGRPDALDTDDDNDGILTKLEDIDNNGQVANDDTDKDGVPNYLDANDDGDSRLTKLEGPDKDSDNDGIPDYLDSSDGVSKNETAKVVVLYDESDAANKSVKKSSATFKLATKSALADTE